MGAGMLSCNLGASGRTGGNLINLTWHFASLHCLNNLTLETREPPLDESGSMPTKNGATKLRRVCLRPKKTLSLTTENRNSAGYKYTEHPGSEGLLRCIFSAAVL